LILPIHPISLQELHRHDPTIPSEWILIVSQGAEQYFGIKYL